MRGRDLRPTSHLTLARDTSVVDRFGQRVGLVECTLQHGDGSFDGIIVRTPAGRRFVDAPDVRRISTAGVTLGLASSDVETPAVDRTARRRGAPAARWGRTEVTEADRDAVIDSLKGAFVEDKLTPEELGRRVETAHVAKTLDELDAALAGLLRA